MRPAIATVVLAGLLLLLAGDPRQAGAADCRTLPEARSEGGYPRYRVRGGHRCWYGVGGSSRRHAARRGRAEAPVDARFDPNPHGDPSWNKPVIEGEPVPKTASPRYLLDDAFNQVGEPDK